MGVDLSSRAVLVSLSISQWAGRKTDKKASAEVAQNHGSNGDWGRYNKSLVAKQAIETYQQAANKMRIYHYEQSLPWDDRGGRVVLSSNFLAYSQKIQALRSEWQNGVDQFLANYPQYREDARISLNGLYRDDDYPAVDALRGKFSCALDVLPLPVAGDFRADLSADQVAAIQAEISQGNDARIAGAMRDVWQRLYNAVSHLAGKLSAPDAIFRDSAIENISDICNALPALNLTGDPDLVTMADEVSRRLAVVSPDACRNSKITRAATAAAADELAKKMAAYI